MKLDASHIYFLGIGGMGMSALARWFHQQGVEVSGYDRNHSLVTKGLETEGIKVFYEADETHLQGVDMVVYTPAIPAIHSEFQAAQRLGLPLYKRAQALGELSKNFRTLAVAGTHGKTTTTAILAHVLRYAGLDCTAFLGGISRNINGNFVQGASDWMVVEADEYDRSFLSLYPEVLLITALDADHLDIYGTEAEMQTAYKKLAARARKLMLWNPLLDDSWQHELPLSYGLDTGNYQASNLRYTGVSTTFDFWSAPTGWIRDISLALPGQHNVLNATAALGLANELGADPTRFKTAIEGFPGYLSALRSATP